MRLEVAGGAVRELRLEPAALLGRIVELAEGVGHFEPADVQLEPLDGVRIVRLLLRERRHLGREVVDERRLDELVLVQALEDLGGDLARRPTPALTSMPRRRASAARRVALRAGPPRVTLDGQLRGRRLAGAFAQRDAAIRRRQRDLMLAERDLIGADRLARARVDSISSVIAISCLVVAVGLVELRAS